MNLFLGIKRFAFAPLLFLALLFLGSSAQSAPQIDSWPPFSMISQSESPTEIIVKRLTWNSVQSWQLEIVSDTLQGRAASVPAIKNYAGMRMEFSAGLYSVYGTDGNVQSRQETDHGGNLLPSEWIVPGFENRLLHQGFRQIGVSPDGRRQMRLEEARRCTRNENGELVDPQCSPFQKIITEFIFNNRGMPLERTVRVDSQVLEKWVVKELTYK